MDITEFIQNFANMFDDTDVSQLSADTEFQDLDEWSSLMTMSTIAMVRTKYGKSLSGKEIHSCQTITDLFNLVSGK